MVKTNYIYATGKKRESSARVRLFKGKGTNTVNGIDVSDYFPGKVMKVLWEKPLSLIEASDKYYFSARIMGGGKMGQLGALVHGLARAISKTSVDKFRAPIKKAGLLTRDPRTRQRRMVGKGGKSRRAKQSPKR